MKILLFLGVPILRHFTALLFKSQHSLVKETNINIADVFASKVNPFTVGAIQKNFSRSNTDVSFTTAVSNSFLSPRKKFIGCRFGIF